MTLASLYFFAHQPCRLRRPQDRDDTRTVAPEDLALHYFDDEFDGGIFRKVAERCYLPATRLLRDMLREHGGHKPFKVSFGLSGTFLEQARRHAPEVIRAFAEVVATGRVELCGETYYHSLASLFDDGKAEFRAQVEKHSDMLASLFGARPTVFRNTEMLYNDAICDAIAGMGFRGIITEGVDWLMASWRSPDFVYEGSSRLPVLLRNYRLSDDVGYRFSNKAWEGHPLRAETFASWLARDTDPTVLVAMDYEALGEHMNHDTGIFDFIRALPREVAKFPQLEWSTPTDVVSRVSPVGAARVSDFATISWADKERDTSAWIGGKRQRELFDEVSAMRDVIARTNDPSFLDVWRKMQTSDHFYYVSSKAASDGDVHRYFSAYGAPDEAHARVLSSLRDLARRAEEFTRRR
jgi:alpha-amylase